MEFDLLHAKNGYQKKYVEVYQFWKKKKKRKEKRDGKEGKQSSLYARCYRIIDVYLGEFFASIYIFKENTFFQKEKRFDGEKRTSYE